MLTQMFALDVKCYVGLNASRNKNGFRLGTRAVVKIVT